MSSSPVDIIVDRQQYYYYYYYNYRYRYLIPTQVWITGCYVPLLNRIFSRTVAAVDYR